MDRERARELADANLMKEPTEFDKNFEAIFANPHFGDVVTEVFPKMLDPHDERGRQLLDKYAKLASFLEETKEDDEGQFLAVRVQTKPIEYRHDNTPPRQSAVAIAAYSYTGLRAESFRVTRDEEGKALGVAVEHLARVYSTGFDDTAKSSVRGVRPYVVIDSIDELTSAWTRGLNEVETPTTFIIANDEEGLVYLAHELDETLRLSLSRPISEIVSDLNIDAFRVSAGLDTKYTNTIT